MNVCMYVCMHVCMYSINQSILYVCMYLSTYLPIYLSICKLENEAFVRDLLNFWTWQHPKRSNSARLPSKTESWATRFAIFPFHLSKVPRLPRKSEARSCEVLHLSRKIILANLKTLQPLSAPRPPNMSSSCVSCTAPATQHASLHILFCPMPANTFETATKPSRFAHFDKDDKVKWYLNVQKCSEHVVF